MEEKNGYAICFNEWALDKSIKNELGLLLIISSLCAEKGYCFASNEYLSNLFKEPTQTISRKIKTLEEKGYITIDYKKNGCTIISREIRLTKMLMAINKNVNGTINKNVKDNNTSINNTMNIKKEYISNDIYSKENVKEDTKKFVKPTIKQIKEYCNERNNGIDAEQFYDFYECKGWLVGKSKMKDWKCAVRNWERNDKKKTTTKKNNRSYLDQLEEKWKKEGVI